MREVGVIRFDLLLFHMKCKRKRGPNKDPSLRKEDPNSTIQTGVCFDRSYVKKKLSPSRAQFEHVYALEMAGQYSSAV